MTSAQRKHQKAIRRKRKLSKRENQSALPFSVELESINRNIKLKNFEEAALLKLQIKKIARKLYEDNEDVRLLFRQWRQAGDENDSNAWQYGANFIGRIIQAIIKCGGAIPPYFIPVLNNVEYRLLPNDRFIPILIFGIFRPDKEKHPEGNIYHYGQEITHNGVTKKLWLTGHSLDRMQERYELTKEDTGFWMNILNPVTIKGNMKASWELISIDQEQFLSLKFFGINNGALSDVVSYFPTQIEKDRIVAVTFLTPGMRSFKTGAILPGKENPEIIKATRIAWRDYVGYSCLGQRPKPIDRSNIITIQQSPTSEPLIIRT